MPRRVLLLIPTTSYKTRAFMDAAERLGVDVVVGSDRRQALEKAMPHRTLALDFARAERALVDVEAFAAARPLAAIVGTDDETTLLAALASRALGLRHNDVAAVRATRDKYAARVQLAASGLRGPEFFTVPLGADPQAAARRAPFPCVLKPRALSAGQGVIRVDNPAAFVVAFVRISAILSNPELRRLKGVATDLLVESYLPGSEVAVEGLLEGGRLRVLALFDKPDPLEGPYFAETLYVTPSRASTATQREIEDEVARGCSALGLTEGPLHAELRLTPAGPTLLEVAARTIGGLCSRTLRFGAGISLEELTLRHALGEPTDDLGLAAGAAGVLMLPVPHAGRLRAVNGVETARAVTGIEDVVVTLHRGAEVVPLPEGHRYLGFVFARDSSAQRVEAALRAAQAALEIDISPATG